QDKRPGNTHQNSLVIVTRSLVGFWVDAGADILVGAVSVSSDRADVGRRSCPISCLCCTEVIPDLVPMLSGSHPMSGWCHTYGRVVLPYLCRITLTLIRPTQTSATPAPKPPVGRISEA